MMYDLVPPVAAAAAAGVSLRLVIHALSRGSLKGIKVGDRWVIPAQEVEAWRERRRAEALTARGVPDRRRRGVDVWVQKELEASP